MMSDFTLNEIAAEDLLDAATTIPLGHISTCNWLDKWTPETTFIDWARRGMTEGTSYGLSNAICYGKRAVACRIDVLVRYNHLAPFFRANYPDKIEALRQLDIYVPDVVHDLVIDPRNILEHSYVSPAKDVAHHAIDVADLFIQASQSEYERSSIVAVNWNVLGSHRAGSNGVHICFREFGKEPMLFIDVFEETTTAKIIDPKINEIRFSSLARFKREHALKLSQILRSNFSGRSLSRNGMGRTYYTEMKRQGGF